MGEFFEKIFLFIFAGIIAALFILAFIFGFAVFGDIFFKVGTAIIGFEDGWNWYLTEFAYNVLVLLGGFICGVQDTEQANFFHALVLILICGYGFAIFTDNV